MSRKCRLVTVALLTSLGMIMTPLPPAHAAAVGVVLFKGKCHLNQHIAIKILIGKKPGAAIAASCKFGDKSGKVNPPATPQQQVWAHLQIPIAKKGKPKPIFTSCIKVAQNDPCTVLPGSVAGGATVTTTVRPHLFANPACGSSQSGPPGSFIILTNPQPETISGSYIEFQSFVFITGTWTHGLQSGPFVAIGHAEPDVQKGDSCWTKPPGADDFTLQGIGWGIKVGPLNNPLPFIDPK